MINKMDLMVSSDITVTYFTSSSHSYAASAEPTLSSVHPELRWPRQASSSGSPSSAEQAPEVPAVPVTDKSAKLYASEELSAKPLTSTHSMNSSYLSSELQ